MYIELFLLFSLYKYNCVCISHLPTSTTRPIHLMLLDWIILVTAGLSLTP
jgi:hypothetical protein